MRRTKRKMRRTRRKRSGYDVDITKSTLYGSGILGFGSSSSEEDISDKKLKDFDSRITVVVRELWEGYASKENLPLNNGNFRVQITKLAPEDIDAENSLSGLSDSLFIMNSLSEIYDKMKKNLNSVLNGSSQSESMIKSRFELLMDYHSNALKKFQKKKSDEN